jgi:hypothetical protein
MIVHSYLVVGIFIAVIVVLFGTILGFAIWAMLWLNRSKSPRAQEIRRLIGGRAKQRDDGSKGFHWTGEDWALRHAAARDYAAKNGFTYAEKDQTLLDRLRHRQGLIFGDGGDIEDVMRRDNVTVATYSRRTTDTWSIDTALFLETAMPAFYATTETLAHKAGLLGSDIDFVEDAHFSDMFHLNSTNERAARGLFGREVRAEFVRVGQCSVESDGTSLLFVEQQQTTVRGYEMFVDESLRLAGKLVSAAAQNR